MKKLKTWGLVFLIIALLGFIGMALIEYYTEPVSYTHLTLPTKA